MNKKKKEDRNNFTESSPLKTGMTLQKSYLLKIARLYKHYLQMIAMTDIRLSILMIMHNEDVCTENLLNKINHLFTGSYLLKIAMTLQKAIY